MSYMYGHSYPPPMHPHLFSKRISEQSKRKPTKRTWVRHPLVKVGAFKWLCNTKQTKSIDLVGTIFLSFSLQVDWLYTKSPHEHPSHFGHLAHILLSLYHNIVGSLTIGAGWRRVLVAEAEGDGYLILVMYTEKSHFYDQQIPLSFSSLKSFFSLGSVTNFRQPRQ